MNETCWFVNTGASNPTETIALDACDALLIRWGGNWTHGYYNDHNYTANWNWYVAAEALSWCDCHGYIASSQVK